MFGNLFNKFTISLDMLSRVTVTTGPDNKAVVVDNMNFVKEKCNSDIRRNFFSKRVVEPWNTLPSSVKNAADVNSFKNLYDSWKK